MIPVRIEGASRRLGAPVGWDETRDEPCSGLWVRFDDGSMASAWEPTADEIERLQQGAPVILHVAGIAHPPVHLSVGSSPQEADRG